MAGTPEKVLEYLLETRMDCNTEDVIIGNILSPHYERDCATT